jgi:hypothetical protein
MRTLTVEQKNIGNELNGESIQEMFGGMAEILMNRNKEIIQIDHHSIGEEGKDDMIAKIYGMKCEASSGKIGYFITYRDRL